MASDLISPSTPAGASELLRVDSLCKSYPTGVGQKLPVLDGLSLTVDRPEFVVIVGESGTGKSTLLHLLGGLDRPDSGTVYFEGQDIFDQSDEQLASFRNRSVGFVFQFHHLLPEFTALENVAMPALIQQRRLSDVTDRAMQLLDLFGLTDRVSHRPGELSGGEQQRVAVARALMNDPPLLLADEPSGNLDTRIAEKLHAELRRLRDELDKTLVVVTHNETLAAIADRVLRLEDHQLHPERVGLTEK